METDIDSSRTLLYGVASISIQAFLLAVVYFKFMYDSEFIPMPQFRMKHVYRTLIVLAVIVIIFHDRPANTIGKVWKMLQQLADSAKRTAEMQPVDNGTVTPAT